MTSLRILDVGGQITDFEHYRIDVAPTVAVPGPLVGAGLPGLLAACLGLLLFNRYRRNRRDGGLMLRWLKRLLRPPLAAGEPYSKHPTPGNLYLLLKKQCPTCGLAPPDWCEGTGPEDAVCVRCSTRFVVPLETKCAYHVHQMRQVN